MITETEAQTRDFAAACNRGCTPQEAVQQALVRLSEAMQRTDNEGNPDWDKLISLRMAVASAMGVLEGSMK